MTPYAEQAEKARERLAKSEQAPYRSGNYEHELQMHIKALDTLARVEAVLEADIDNRFAAFEKWKSDYALQSEPNYSLETEYDCTEAFLAGIEFASGSALKALEGGCE